jgi:anti-sigma factor RsiW
MSNRYRPTWQRRILGCSEIEDLLDEYIDEQLSPPLVKSYEHHLERCEDCRELVHDCRQIVELARALPEPQLPDGLHERLTRRLEGELGVKFSAQAQVLRFAPKPQE